MVQQARPPSVASTCFICNPASCADKMSFNMSEGSSTPSSASTSRVTSRRSRFAGAYCGRRPRDGASRQRRGRHHRLGVGLYGNAGRSITPRPRPASPSMTIVLARELGRSGVRVNRSPRRRHPAARHGRSGEDLADNRCCRPTTRPPGRCGLASPLGRGDHRSGAQDQRRPSPDPRRLAPATQISSDQKWTLQALADGRDLPCSRTRPRRAPFRRWEFRGHDPVALSRGRPGVVVDSSPRPRDLQLLHVENSNPARTRSARRPRCRRRARSDRRGTAP